MKRILLVLAIVAGSAFMAAPASAEDAVAGDTVAAAEPTTTETTTTDTPAPEEQAAPAEEQAAPAEEQAAPAEEAPAAEAPAEEPATEAAPAPEPKAAVLQPAAPKEKVTICHGTSAVNNPYVQNRPAVEGDISGHADDDGAIFDPNTNVNGDHWGDIIPPVPSVDFPGLNWDAAGQAIWENGCNLTDVEVTVVTPAAPTATPPTCEAPGALVIPNITGLTYSWEPEGTGPGTYDVTVVADQGFVIADGATVDWEVEVLDQLGSPECDTPTSPSFVLTDRCTGGIVDVNTEGTTRIVPVAGDGGYTWEFTEGDGQNGPWTLEFTPKDGFTFADDAVHSISGDAGNGDECVDAVLPNTGGSSPWILLMGAGLTVGGVLLLSGRAALGLAGSGPVGAPSPMPMTWTQEVLTTRELKSHRGESRRRGWSWILTGKRS